MLGFRAQRFLGNVGCGLLEYVGLWDSHSGESNGKECGKWNGHS